MTDDDIGEGWYTDAYGAIRWWDGAQWTEHVKDADEPESTVVLPAADGAAHRSEPGADADEPDHRRRTWLVATFVGLLAFFLGMGIGGSGNNAELPVVEDATASSGATAEDLDQRETDLKTRESDLAAKQNDLDQREQDLESRESELRNGSSGSDGDDIENGVYEVGVDVQPGQYASDGPEDSDLPCQYRVSNDEDGQDIITSEVTEGPGTVTLAAGQFFRSEYCEKWELQ